MLGHEPKSTFGRSFGFGSFRSNSEWLHWGRPNHNTNNHHRRSHNNVAFNTVKPPGMWGYKWIKYLIKIEVVDYNFLGTYESEGYPDDAYIGEKP
ncbi:MAG: hypothetical protein PWP49_661 [Thermococcaceae archaeon]|nr:hypothetical protein [Thermococcaceae archaeon]